MKRGTATFKLVDDQDGNEWSGPNHHRIAHEAET